MKKGLILIIAAIALAGCAKSEDVFSDVGTSLASPSAMSIDVASNRMYLVNSNSNVLYDWQQGNFQVLDITDPLAPALIKSVQTESFSGTIYLDLAANRAFVPNRFEADSRDTVDALYSFSVDESSFDDLLGYTSSALAKDAYAIACCYPARWAWITTSVNELQCVDLDGDLVPGSQSLLTSLDDGSYIAAVEAYHLILNANQAILSRSQQGVMILNLDEVGMEGVAPVNYFIYDIDQPRGIALDGSYLYVVGEGNEDDSWRRFVLVLDISGLTPLTDNTAAVKVDKNDSGILVKLIEVGQSPQEILLTSSYIFVTNMGDNTVSVIDRASLEKVADIAVDKQPFSLALYTALDGTERYVYVGNVESNTISIIDISTLSVVATYP